MIDKNREKFNMWLKETPFIDSYIDSIIAIGNFQEKEKESILDMVYCAFQAGMLNEAKRTTKMLEEAILKI